jgi:hypothetical protein
LVTVRSQPTSGRSGLFIAHLHESHRKAQSVRRSCCPTSDPAWRQWRRNSWPRISSCSVRRMHRSTPPWKWEHRSQRPGRAAARGPSENRSHSRPHRPTNLDGKEAAVQDLPGRSPSS